MKDTVPQERFETIRQGIIRLIAGNPLAAIEISQEIGESEKDITYHLNQIGKSGILRIIPSECANCGFIFKERTRSTKPGKCPSCKGTQIHPPLFTIKKK